MPRFNGGMKSMTEYERTATRHFRKRELMDHNDAEKAFGAGAEAAESRAKRYRDEMFGACGEMAVITVDMPDSTKSTPLSSASRAMNILAVQMQRDLRRQSAMEEEDEEEFNRMVEEHAGDEPGSRKHQRLWIS